MPQATDKPEEDKPLPDQPKEKKEDDVLNLNNEVVKMRKEVKRVRTLIIRKMTRQISALRKKKGKEIEIERNQRRAARLLEEIHAIKSLAPDLVTKTALQKKLNFEQVCKNPKSSISDRGIARIATHPLFSKRIEAIKAAVKAFKEERMKGRRQGEKKGKEQSKTEKETPQSTDTDRKGEERNEQKEEKSSSAEQKEMIDNVEGKPLLKDIGKATVAEPSEKDGRKATSSADVVDLQKKEIPHTECASPALTKNKGVKVDVKNETQSKVAEKKPNLKPAPKVPQKEDDEEESDLETSDDEEKEYFDDSTEERFRKQSSQSEDSDGQDDFFLGKASKFKKKKKKNQSGEEEKRVERRNEVKTDSADQLKTSEQGQSEFDELESRLKSKATKLQTIFCSSLSGLKASEGGGAGRGTGKNQSRGQGKQKDGRNFGRPSKLQEQGKGPDGNSRSNYSKPYSEGRHPASWEKGSAFAGRGRGRGRGNVVRERDSKRGASQPALHPSWEASKKRKEQQGQILAFQGKKIKFDDDDD
ncbi:hypothetical protein LDENG_00035380 [Lucifuga dentata]|nr:hypothetical protein LDENG_00035380 [Lucifuga dentata]